MATDADVDRSPTDQRAHRLHELAAAGGPSALPYRFVTDHTAAQVRAAHGGLGPDVDTGERVRVAGRLDLIRYQGGLSFGELRDRTGTVQLFVDTAGGSQQQCDAHEPASLLAGTRFPGMGGRFQVGTDDAEPLAAAQCIVGASRGRA